MVATTGAPADAGRRNARMFQSVPCDAAVRQWSSNVTTEEVSAFGTSVALDTVAAPPRAAGAGGASPISRYTPLLAHGYEITTPEYTTSASGIADQKPSTLCQLK